MRQVLQHLFFMNHVWKGQKNRMQTTSQMEYALHSRSRIPSSRIPSMFRAPKIPLKTIQISAISTVALLSGMAISVLPDLM